MSTRSGERSPTSPLEEFELVYLRNVEVLMGYFGRRCREPQTVADLASETFVRAMEGFAKFDPRRGSERAWLVAGARLTMRSGPYSLRTAGCRPCAAGPRPA